MLVLGVTLFMMSCNSSTELTPISKSDTIIPQPVSESTQLIELTEAKSLGYISYVLSGEGNSGNMMLTINNETEIEGKDDVEVETKLEAEGRGCCSGCEKIRRGSKSILSH